MDKNPSMIELNGSAWVRGGKPPNSEVLVPDDDEEKEEERKKKKEKRCPFNFLNTYQQFTGSSCYCHRLSIKVDVFQISVAIIYMYRLLC